MTDAHFGDLPGIPAGTLFPNRAALSKARVHGPPVAGIWGLAANGGAQSIVLSGGYEDDEDHGDIIVYTGQGGQKDGRQVADQDLTRGNAALYVSRLSGRAVRVNRGHKHKSPYSPARGFRYDGLFRVTDAWQDHGKSGFVVWRFRLERLREAEAEPAAPADMAADGAAPAGEPDPTRRGSWVVRTVRDTAVSRYVKILNGYACQVCGVVLETAGGPYAEAAHIKPIGKPHLGPDVVENCLCLCPNHHVLFDQGAFTIDASDHSLVGIPGFLRLTAGHQLEAEYLEYHRQHYAALAPSPSRLQP